MPGFYTFFCLVLSRRYGIEDALSPAICCDAPGYVEYVEPWEIGQLMGGN